MARLHISKDAHQSCTVRLEEDDREVLRRSLSLKHAAAALEQLFQRLRLADRQRMLLFIEKSVDVAIDADVLRQVTSEAEGWSRA